MDMEHLTVVIALKVCDAIVTIAELAFAASLSSALVCRLYKAAVAAVETMTDARIGPSLHDR